MSNTTKPVVNVSITEMERALPKLEKYIARIDSIDVTKVRTGKEQELLYMSQRLEQLLVDLYGNHSHQYEQYKHNLNIQVRAINPLPPESNQELVQEYIGNALVTLNSLKDSFLEKLESSKSLGSPEHVLKAYEGLELHHEISKVTSDLFRDGHYSNAIENAVKALNHLVRKRTGLLEDGVSLMQKAFSPSNPLLKFNELVDESDKNEQKGFMEWFTGTVSGLRNPRAHKIIKDEPEMALEFIAFVSLQAKLVDKAKCPKIT